MVAALPDIIKRYLAINCTECASSFVALHECDHSLLVIGLKSCACKGRHAQNLHNQKEYKTI